MRNTYLYGTFAYHNGDNRFYLTWNKDNAIRAIKRLGNGEVRRVIDCPEITAWDSPTFHALSEQIFAL